MFKTLFITAIAAGISTTAFAAGDGGARKGEIFNFGMLHLEWPTALFIFVIFLLTMTVLNTMLFKPILRTLEARQSELDKNTNESKSLAQTIETSEQDYQAKLADLRETIQKSRQEAIDEAISSTKDKVDQAKASAAKKLEDAEKELESERKSALEQAASLTAELSQLIKSKVIA
ncbi:MAG: ATP synthase F0 subunit B [Proteobacteria bacterium]|nr:ATP synthase F0 subunit B [Pseudomonadota bacterium]